jgi:hypothetical protein
MPMVCPQCNGSFENGVQCPQCNARLLYQPAFQAVEDSPAPRGRWHQTLSGRFFVGLLLALGLSYGLLQLGTGLLNGLRGPDQPLPFLPGLLLFLGLQGAAALASGLLTGAGQRQGVTLGATVGIVAGALAIVAFMSGVLTPVVRPFAAALLDPAAPLRVVVVYGLPILYTVGGGLGGLVGGLVWRPPADLTLPANYGGAPAEARGPVVPLKGRDFPFAGPVYWVRVLIGVTVAVVGAMSPRAVIDFMHEASDGALQVTGTEQVRVLTAEIFAFSILIGGCIAGATTPNGLKQGLCVGIGAGVAVAGLLFRSSDPHPGLVLLPLFSTLLLGSMGGWFGGQLLPPTAPRRRKRSSLLD